MMIVIQMLIILIIPAGMIICGRKLSKNIPGYKAPGFAYKTRTSKLSEETWIYANRLFANILFTAGINTAAAAFLFTILAVCLTDVNGWALSFTVAGFEAVSLLLPAAVTEKMTLSDFDENGELRKDKKKRGKA